MKKQVFLRNRKRLLSFVLAVIMVCMLMPIADGARVYAAEGDVTDGTYVNMPKSGTETVTLGRDVKDFKVYDDGGIDGNYSYNCDGYLLIQAPEGYVLRLTGNMKTEETYDILTIYDGSNTSSDKLIDKLSGIKSVDVVSSGSSMLIHFYSDESTNGSGFDFTVNLLHKVEFTYGYSVIATEYTTEGGTVSLPSVETILGDDYVSGTDYSITYTYGDNQSFTADTPVTDNMTVECKIEGICSVTLTNGEKVVTEFVQSGNTYTFPTISELLDMLGEIDYAGAYLYTLIYTDSDGREITDGSVVVESDMVVNWTYTYKLIMQGDGSPNNPYQIGNVGQLYWFAGLVDGILKDGTTQNIAANAVLTADITVNESVLDAEGNLASNTGDFIIWTPIGKNASYTLKSYTGSFDGNGHIISGLYAPSDSDFCGFFGKCNGTIKNLGITDSFFGGRGFHGATFVGSGEKYCVIENCFSTSVISGDMYCGGIAGDTQGTIRNCYFAGRISASSFFSSAIASDHYNQGTLSNCYYLDTCGLTSTRATSKTAQEFASGEVAYRLQGEQAEPIWGQNLAEDSKQAYPVFFGTPVYKVGTYQGCEGNPGDATYFYSNTNENVYAPHIDDGSIDGSVPYDNKCDRCGGNAHHFIDGICDVEGCGYREGVIVNKTYPTEIVYGDEAIIPSADEFAIKSGATPTFTWYKGDVTSGELPTDGDDAFLGESTPKDAGVYTLVVNAAGTKLNDETGTVYTAAELRIKVTIVKADATVTGVPVAAANLTYDQGNAITLIDDSNVSYIGGTELQYALGADGTYSTSLPTATDAGTYDVYYKVVGDGNHNDTTPVKIEVTVKRADSSIVFTGYTPGREYNRKPLDNPTAEQLTLTGAEYSDVTFTWYKDSVTEENKLTEAPTDAGDYYVVASIPQSTNYNASSRESEKITISRTTPKYTTPTDVKAICGNMLSKVELPEGFSWTDTDVALEAGDLEAGAQVTKKAKYVPTDITNYKEVTDIEISIQVTHDLSATQLEGNEGAEKHISKCSACGNSFNETACSGGTATCTDRAVCSVCNKPYGTVDADNHSFTKYVSEHDATCVVNGHETATCDYGCGKKNTKIEENSSLGHSYIETFNWTADGLACTVTFTCDREGCTEDTEGHSASYDCTVTSNVKIPATCTAKGTTTYTAAYTYNGKTYTDTKDVEDIAKVDHTFGEWVVTKQATEDEKGEKEKSCSCGYKITAEIEKLAHTIHVKDEGTRVEPTCEENGSITYKCKKCGEVIEVVVLDAVGHNWDNGKVTKEATKTAEGIKTYTCTVCGKTKTQSIPKKKAGEEKQLKKGDVVTDDKRAARVKVADVKKKEVEYKEPVNKKAKTVTIPATVKINGTTYKVTKISDNAFKGNKIVTRITVGKNVKSIGKNVFSGTTKLKTITFKTTKLTQKTVSKNAFKGISKSTTIKVPKKKLSAYKKLFKSKGLSSKVKVKGY